MKFHFIYSLLIQLTYSLILENNSSIFRGYHSIVQLIERKPHNSQRGQTTKHTLTIFSRKAGDEIAGSANSKRLSINRTSPS